MLNTIMLASSAEYLGGLLFDIFNAGIFFFHTAFDFKKNKKMEKKKVKYKGRRCISHGCLYLPGAGGACFALDAAWSQK